MKINNECARTVLLKVESLPYGETTTAAKLQEKFPEYSIEEMLATVTILNKEHLLTILDKASYDDSDIFRDHKIKCLTEVGFRALDLIRDEKDWNNLKEKIDNFDELSIFSILDISMKIFNVKHNKLFGLPEEMIAKSWRW